MVLEGDAPLPRIYVSMWVRERRTERVRHADGRTDEVMMMMLLFFSGGGMNEKGVRSA